MATVKLDIKKALSPIWLLNNNFSIELPSNKVFRLRLLKVLFDNIPNRGVKEKIDILRTISNTISDRTLYKFQKACWKCTPVTIGKKINDNTKRLEELKLESFMVEVIENATNLPKYHFRVKFDSAEDIKIHTTQHIDPDRVELIKKSQISIQTAVNIRSEEEKEAIALKICEYLATGMVDLNQATNKFGVASKDFMVWMSTNQIISEMFMQAIAYAKFQRSLSMGLALDTRIEQMLQQGYTETETISYKRVYSQFHPSGVWIEMTKNVTKRSIDERGAALLHGILTNTEVPNLDMDEFDSLSIDEQYEKVQALMLQNDKLKKKASK